MARESWTDQRLDDLKGSMNERFDAVDRRMDERFDRADSETKLRFKQVEGQIEGLREAMKELHTDNKEMQRTITQAITSICAIMIGGFAAIVAALIGAGAF